MTSAQWIGLLNVAALVAIMLSMGLRVRPEAVWSAARPARLVMFCVLANYVLVPLIALGLLLLFQADPFVSIGFLVLAICPGAPVGPPITGLARGNLAQAISMMVLLAALSAVLSPALLAALAPRLTPAGEINVDPLTIARNLFAAQLAPLAIGLALHRWKPTWADRLNRPLSLLANLLLVILLSVIIASNLPDLVKVKFLAWFGMTLLFAASWIVGWVCGGRSNDSRKAIAITTVNRNVAVGLMIVADSFAKTPAVVAVVAYGLFSIVGSLACAFLLRSRRVS